MQEKFRLVRQGLGAIPIIDSVIERIGLLEQLTLSMKNTRYAEAIIVLLKNILIERNALYAIQEWSARFDPDLVHGGKQSDDVFARSLDRLFETDRASLMTGIVIGAVKKYKVDLSQMHQDTTSIKVTGAYARQAKKAVKLARGHSKDHRPDLKQLVYELSVTRDGAIPILFKSHDGNRTDDTLHWDNWQTLRGVLGRSDFLYVADSKLCVSKTLLNIDRNQGRFVTVLPQTRDEAKQFSQKVEVSLARWEKVAAKRSAKTGRIDLYEVVSGIHQMREGFRIYWYRSTEKARRDWDDREERISVAMAHIRSLGDPNRKKKPKTEKALRKKAEEIIARFKVGDWIEVNIGLECVEKFRQVKRGRSTADTMFRRTVKWVPSIGCSRNESAISKSEAMDGIFPLVTNTDLDARGVLSAYKYQPKLERRHALLKSGLHVAPIFLKKNDRIEALMCVYFLAQLVGALIERELRNAMRIRGLKHIQILPEDRPSATPTVEQVMRVFAPCTRHILLSKGRDIVQTFNDPLTPIQEQILSLLSVPPRVYM
jgi:transposase